MAPSHQLPVSPSMASTISSFAGTPALSSSSSFPNSPSTDSEGFASPELVSIPSFTRYNTGFDSIVEEARAGEADEAKAQPEFAFTQQSPPAVYTPGGRTRHSSYTNSSPRPASIASSRAPTVLSVGGRGLASDEACQIMANHLLSIAQAKGWATLDQNVASAVAIRFGRHRHVVSGERDFRLDDFHASIERLDPEVAFTYNGLVAQAVLDTITMDATVVPISRVVRIQVVETMAQLADARRGQKAAFIRENGTLVIWDDNVRNFEATCARWEAALINYVWSAREKRRVRDDDGDLLPINDGATADMSEMDSGGMTKSEKASWDDDQSIAELASQPKERPVMLYSAAYQGLSTGLNILICSLMPMKLLRECLADGNWTRMALCVVLPFFFFVIMFVADSIIGALAQILAPISQMGKNSLYYSGVAPTRLRGDAGPLPHITVVMPVYKEGLRTVLAPTIESLQVAIQTYELQGGTANILVCEDGMQLVDAAERKRREDFYAQNNCGWVARQPGDRAGRFKKSSNMNTVKQCSLRVEELMDAARPTIEAELERWTQQDEDNIYNVAFQQALDESEGKLWGAGNIRIGDYILLVDSDTRIPADSFLDAASEMEQSPEVGILQHGSGTFLSGAGFFENGIAYFTSIVNGSISWTVACGGTSPFMGHNAYLRWSALQDQARANPGGKIWSEEHVSEDFVMSLNLINAGYTLRWATYSNQGYLEGVSLSCDDELNRWQKYSWGCSEMVFNPIRYWFTKTPFAKLYRDFLWSPAASLPSKFATTSYVASYWAIASGPPLTIAMWLISGLFGDYLDPVYQLSFSILLSTIVIFSGGTSLAIITMRFRSQLDPFKTALWNQVKWLAFFVFFFTGLAYHVCTALVAHIIGINMSWTTTSKDVVGSCVGEQLGDIGKRHWRMFIIMGGSIIAGIIMATDLVPMGWQIIDWVIMLPLFWLCGFHILYPFVLNPWIMLLRF